MTQQHEEHLYLRSQKDGADKDYNLHLEKDPGDSGMWRLLYENGKHGAALKKKEKIEGSVPYDEAKKVFDQTLKEKLSAKGGYVSQAAGVEYQSLVQADRVSGLAPQLLKSIPEAVVYERMDDPSYLWQEKKDGERRMIRKTTEGAGTAAVVTVIGTNRDGLIVPIPKDLADAVAALPLPFIVLDGEDMGQGRYAAFDLVATDNDLKGQRGCEERWLALQQLLRAAPSLCWVSVAIATTPEAASELDKMVRARGGEGLVGKLKTAPYTPGIGEDQFKFPYLDRATVYVESHDGAKRSVNIAALGANGQAVSLKKVAIPVNYDLPQVGAIVDVEYLYAYPSGGLAQPRYKGIRSDRGMEHCVLSQLKFKANDSCAPLNAHQHQNPYESDADDQSDDVSVGMAPGS